MAILNTSFNLHVFSMGGWLPPPCPVTMTAFPTRVKGMITLGFCFCFCLFCFVFFFFLVSSALAGKTHRDFVGCCCCLLWNQVNIWLYLPRALMDFNQSWVIDATWEPSFVDEVRGHISWSKVIWGQVVRLVESVKVVSIWKVEVGLEPNLFYW